MQIKYQKTPNWDAIVKKFQVKETDHTFYTYGDCIYSPSGIPPSDDLIVHESVHAEQQEHHNDVAVLWWERYIRDPQFRADQEIEAYGTQYRFICQKYKQRDVRAKYLTFFAKTLSGVQYDHCIDLPEAIKQIRIFADHGRGKLSTI